jgi:hypothetical protein
MNEDVNTDVQPTNDEIEAILTQAYARTQALLREHAALLMTIVGELLAHGQIAKEKMAALLGVPVAQDDQMLVAYADQLKVFTLQHELMQRMKREQVVVTSSSGVPAICNTADRVHLWD